MHDLVIRGGRFIDPSQNIDAVMDVAINGLDRRLLQHRACRALPRHAGTRTGRPNSLTDPRRSPRRRGVR